MFFEGINNLTMLRQIKQVAYRFNAVSVVRCLMIPIDYFLVSRFDQDETDCSEWQISVSENGTLRCHYLTLVMSQLFELSPRNYHLSIPFTNCANYMRCS